MEGDSSMAKSTSKPKFNSLPSGTTAENLLSLINILKKNNKSEETVKALFKMSTSVYSRTKAALIAFGIIEKDSLEFTANIGREIAFSGRDNKRDEMIRIVKSYEPYELVLNSVETSRNETKVTNIDEIKDLWGLAHYGSGDRNWNDGATFFMGVIEYIGFGKYLKGRGNNQTRIEWVTDIKEKITALTQSSPLMEQIEDESQDAITSKVVDMIPVVEQQEQQEQQEQDKNTPAVIVANERNAKAIMSPISAISFPNITINVDMSDWSDEKIKIFFKYAYGKFEED